MWEYGKMHYTLQKMKASKKPKKSSRNSEEELKSIEISMKVELIIVWNFENSFLLHHLFPLFHPF